MNVATGSYWWEHYSSGVKAQRGIVRICKEQGTRFIVVADVYNVTGEAEDHAEAMVNALNGKAGN